jgi:hypothetical protein
MCRQRLKGLRLSLREASTQARTQRSELLSLWQVVDGLGDEADFTSANPSVLDDAADRYIVFDRLQDRRFPTDEDDMATLGLLRNVTNVNYAAVWNFMIEILKHHPKQRKNCISELDKAAKAFEDVNDDIAKLREAYRDAKKKLKKEFLEAVDAKKKDAD